MHDSLGEHALAMCRGGGPGGRKGGRGRVL